MLNRIKHLIVLPLVVCVSFLHAQDSIEIMSKRIVNQRESLTIKAGTTVLMGPGATLEVMGSLIVEGTEANPVKFVNLDSSFPAAGIVVSGIEESGIVRINGVHFDGFVQPLRFEPFWYRKTVSISYAKITNSPTFEPVIYFASPFLDLRADKKIDLSIEYLDVINNISGVLIEYFGTNTVNFKLNKLYFADNEVPVGHPSFGLLHLDFADNFVSDDLTIGDLAFERNTVNFEPFGISVGGSSKQKVKVNGLFGDVSNLVVYDQKKDKRIPLVEVLTQGSIKDFGKDYFIKSIFHKYGDLRIVAQGDLKVERLIAAGSDLVEITRNLLGDTQIYQYIQGVPVYAKLNDGRKVLLPVIPQENLPVLLVTKIDTADYNNYRRSLLPKSIGKEKRKISLLDILRKIPTFAKQDENVKKLEAWEIGFWGGGAAYGGGDLKHRRLKDIPTASNFVKTSPIIRDIPQFSTLEISLGLYGQYNLSSRFSMRASYYNSKISTWNLSAQGLFSPGRDLVTFDNNLNKIYLRAYGSFFVTHLNNFELEGLWHLRPYKLQNAKKARWIPTLGINFGVVHYNPYREVYINGEPSKSVGVFGRIGYLWGDKVFETNNYNLRDLGSEGQNFLPGQKPYSPFALSAGSSFQLTYMRKNWALKGEMKFVYTSTDYLDDFGPGLWYGGDVNKVKQNHQYDNIDPADLNQIIGYNGNVGKSSQRSTDGLNDWYYQAHLGYSYFLFRK